MGLFQLPCERVYFYEQRIKLFPYKNRNLWNHLQVFLFLNRERFLNFVL